MSISSEEAGLQERHRSVILRLQRREISVDECGQKIHALEQEERQLWRRQHPISIWKFIIGIFFPLLFINDPYGIRRSKPKAS